MTRQIILNFHGLGRPPAWIEESERPYWVDIELFREVVERTAGRPDVSFTFDDGNRSDLDAAAPILLEHRRTAIFFILTGRLDHPSYLSPADLKQLAGMGMRLGLHGRDHVDWRRLDQRVLVQETIEARQVLAEAAGVPIEDVSVPFGAYNRRVVNHLRRSGFNAIFTSDGGAANTRNRIRNRTSLRSDMSRKVLDMIIAGRSAPRDHVRRGVSTFARRYII